MVEIRRLTILGKTILFTAPNVISLRTRSIIDVVAQAYQF